MSDAQALYSELKVDLQLLAEPLFEASQLFVRKRGAFLPFGAVLKQDDEPQMIMAAPDGFEERDVSSEEVLPLLHQSLRSAANTENAEALAVAEDVRITPEGEKETAAMKVLIEHKRGLCIAYYVPYSRSFLRRYKFGEMIARAAEPEVKAWQ
jgi:hypothetical protein